MLMHGRTKSEAPQKMNAWLCGAAWMVVLLLPDYGNQTWATEPQAELEKVLSSVSYGSGGAARALTLKRLPIRSLQGLELEQYFKSHPNETSVPNTAFLLVDSPAGESSKGRLVWVAYVYHDRAIVP